MDFSRAVAELNEAIDELIDRLNRPAFPQAGRHAGFFIRKPRSPSSSTLADQALSDGGMEDGPGQHRLSRGGRSTLLQRSLSARRPTAGSPLHGNCLELFHGGKRVTSHARSSLAYRPTTIPEHMPKSHQAHLEWTPSRLIHWGETVGSATAEVIRTILASKPHPEMGYRACLGILRLAMTYSNQRLEAASQRALQLQAGSYFSLRSILKRSLNQQTALDLEPGKSGPQHENVRGADYYDPPTTLLP